MNEILHTLRNPVSDDSPASTNGFNHGFKVVQNGFCDHPQYQPKGVVVFLRKSTAPEPGQGYARARALSMGAAWNQSVECHLCFLRGSVPHLGLMPV